MNIKNQTFPAYFLALAIALAFLSACTEKEPKTLFTKVNETHSGLLFNNRIILNDSVNILDNEFVYNGAGVALGDMNGDGLDDIFLTGNQVDNKLFLNKGNLKFEYILELCGYIYHQGIYTCLKQVLKRVQDFLPFTGVSTLLLKVCHSVQYPLEGCKK